MKRSIPYVSLCITCISLLACGMCSSEPVNAPPPDEELSKAHSTEQKVIVQDAPVAEESAETAPSDVKTTPLAERPVIAGFSDISFGMTVDEAKKNRALKERCQERPFFGKSEPENPDQEIEEWFGLCVAKFAGKKVNMHLEFDQNKELYEIRFSFRQNFSKGIFPLSSDEIEPFISELRGVLEPDIGEPIDQSQKGVTGRTLYSLVWEGRTDDSPPHETQVELSIGDGLMGVQEVVWKDLSRDAAMKEAIERERREQLKSKGL